MKKTALIIMIITLFSKVLGFGRDLVLSYFFGASNISDAYLISLTIPSVIFGFIGMGIATAYIPMLSRVNDESGELAGDSFTSNLTNIIIILTSVFFVLCMVFTEPLVRLFAMGFSGETLSLAIIFTRISLIGIIFMALISIFSGYLQIKKEYIVPALIGFPLNIVVVISIVIASKGDYSILAWGTLLATISQFLLIAAFVRKGKFNYSFHINFKDDRIKRTLYIALPIIIGTSIAQLNVLIDRTISSSLAIGGISTLNYANKINLLVQGLFVTSIITVMYPMISKYATKKNFEGIKQALSESINLITIFVMPMTIGAMIFSYQIVDLLFGRGAFDSNAIQMTSSALFFYAIGMIGFGLREVLSISFYAMQDTKTPMINAALGIGLNIILNIILSRFLGIGGLALATSISGIFTAFLLFISLRKKIGPFGLKKISVSFIKISVASISMGIISYSLFKFMSLNLSQNFSLLVSIVVGALSYLLIIYFMKIEDVDVIVNAIKKKFGKA